MKTNNCKQCGVEFQKEFANHNYCSNECKKEAKNSPRRKEPIIKNCVVCDKEFIQKRKDKITCDASCSQRLWVKNNPDKNWDRYNSESAKLKKKKWREENVDKVRAIKNRYKMKKYNTDVLYNLKESTSNLIRNSFKSKGSKKTKTTDILGCSINEFKIYLESKFDSWMSWENKGNWDGIPTKERESWDIDHIIPLDTAVTEEDVIRLNHYTNLQPLCSYTNRYLKKNKIYLVE